MLILLIHIAVNLCFYRHNKAFSLATNLAKIDLLHVLLNDHLLLIYILLKMTRSYTFFAPVPMIMIGMWFLKPHNTFHVRIWRHINRMIYWNNNQAINFHFYIYFTTCLTNYTITIFVTLHYFWCICYIPYHYLTTGTRVICELNVNSEKRITSK